MISMQGSRVIAYVVIIASIFYMTFTRFSYYSSLFTSTSQVQSRHDHGLQLISHTIVTNVSSLTAISMLTINTYTHCFVTAYMDLDRHLWNDTPRANQEYMTRFRRLVSSVFEPLVIFIDDRHLQQVTHIVMETRPRALYTAIVPINTSFLVKYIHAWKFLPREHDLMTSNAYLRQVPMSLRHLPEHTVPSYTLINHAKIDFVMFVITHLHGSHDIGHGHDKHNVNTHQSLPMTAVGYDRYSWIDFGYLHADHFMPQGPFRSHLLASDNITYMTLRPLEPMDGDPVHMLSHDLERVTGGFFSGTVPVLQAYQTAYHRALSAYQTLLHIADDDQAMVPYIYYHHYPHMTFIPVASYKHALLYFCDGISARVKGKRTRKR